jgi:hypothetical protein
LPWNLAAELAGNSSRAAQSTTVRQVVLGSTLTIESDGRVFELIIVNDDAAIIEHGTDEPAMMFEELEDALHAWADLHEEFHVPCTQEEIEVLDECEIQR